MYLNEIKEDYCIYVNDKSEYLQIQKFMFTVGIYWCGLDNRTKIFESWSWGDELYFPRYINVYYYEGSKYHQMGNNDILKRIKINASAILRKHKLEKINVNKNK